MGGGGGGNVFIPYKFFFRKINLDAGTTASCTRRQEGALILRSRNVHPMDLQTSTRRFDILSLVATLEYLSCFSRNSARWSGSSAQKIKLRGQWLIIYMTYIYIYIHDIWYMWYIIYTIHDTLYDIWYDTIWYDTIYDMIYLLTANGLIPGGSSTVHISTQIRVHRTTQWKQNIQNGTYIIRIHEHNNKIHNSQN